MKRARFSIFCIGVAAIGLSILAYLTGCAASPPVGTGPVADAGPSQQVPVFASVVLNGSASFDPDGEAIVLYHWTQIVGPFVVIENADSPVATFLATSTGGLVFQLTVQDASGNVGTSTTTVDVF